MELLTDIKQDGSFMDLNNMMKLIMKRFIY